jgi:hypothetical protein
LILALPTVTWVLIAGNRLKTFIQDFRGLNAGLLLLLLISVGTIVLPMITCIGLGTDMPPLWALQGLFLFALLIVCGASYPISRFHSVNLAVLVIGTAAVAVIVVAPVHALYRNSSHPLHEGRNFYQQAAAELTRQWHEQFDAAFSAVGGDEGLAFATAFYSPDHPVFEQCLVVSNTEALPREANFRQGWAAMCYGDETDCIASIKRTAARASGFVETEFVVQTTLLGRPGARQRFTAFMVPPHEEENIAPSPSPGIRMDVSARRRTHGREPKTTGASR